LRDLQVSSLDHGLGGYHRGIPGPDLTGRGGIRMAGRQRSRIWCLGARSAAFGGGAPPLRSGISLVGLRRALSQVRRREARSARPRFPISGRQGKRERRRSGYTSLMRLVFLEPLICTPAVGPERKPNDFNGPSGVARFDPPRLGCFSTA